MKIYPEAQNNLPTEPAKIKEPSKLVQVIAYIIAFASVYYFFLKLLFL